MILLSYRRHTFGTMFTVGLHVEDLMNNDGRCWWIMRTFCYIISATHTVTYGESYVLSVCPACLPACLLACLPACLRVCLSVCLSDGMMNVFVSCSFKFRLMVVYSWFKVRPTIVALSLFYRFVWYVYHTVVIHLEQCLLLDYMLKIWWTMMAGVDE